jgi:nuclear cap-binding protein subunit 2
MASELFIKNEQEEISPYYKYKQNIDKDKLKNSSTLYIGNLSYNTTEFQLYQLFSFCGKIKRVIMGLNRLTKSPCGFAFIEYLDKESAQTAKKALMGTIIDGKELAKNIREEIKDGREEE